VHRSEPDESSTRRKSFQIFFPDEVKSGWVLG
jgi:hypothetical protein